MLSDLDGDSNQIVIISLRRKIIPNNILIEPVPHCKIVGFGILEELQTAGMYVGIAVIVIYSEKITALIQCGSGVSGSSQLFRAYCCVKTGIFIA